MGIAIYTLTSPLHNELSVKSLTEGFLSKINLPFTFKGEDFSDYGKADLNLIFVRTGGTENIFKQKEEVILSAAKHPVYLLASDTSNSLPASLEILSYLVQRGVKGEIIHGTASLITSRIEKLFKIQSALNKISRCRAAVIGKPSDWLISSGVNREIVKDKLGLEIEEITIAEVEEAYNNLEEEAACTAENEFSNKEAEKYFAGAVKIYRAIKKVVLEHNADAFTIRCFDLLTSLKNTGCWALAKLNSEGVVAGCEGDIPAMLSMIISRAVSGVSGFQANPSRIDSESGEILFAHCTVPLNMVKRYQLDTHFESGIGVGIRGFMEEGDVTLFKVAGDISRSFTAEGKLLSCQSLPNLCRTQMLIKLDNKEDCKYFFREPIGNHHIIIPGRFKEILDGILR
ncbi:MAG: hypothetical protein IKS79_06010 [Bacteroidales bacterium]|nr:hypothetical protein [Bacteroidales bacterium]